MDRQDALTWFEIPAADLARATRFYETVLGRKLKPETMGPQSLAVFDYAQPGVGGCVIRGEGFTPGASGTIVYLAAGPRLDDALGRVERAGGHVVLQKTALPGDMGCFAHILDSEGNRVGLHALQ